MDQAPRTADAVIAGAGIIGLSLALELRRRGLSVIVLERDRAMASASFAAGGMLAVHDPQNPPALLPLSLLSNRLYPEYLAHIKALSGKSVPFRTRYALQYATSPAGPIATSSDLAELAPGLNPGTLTFTRLEEPSLDPRDLCAALPAAFLASGGTLLEQTELLHIETHATGVTLHTSGQLISAAHFIDCRGAWAGIQPGIQTHTHPGVQTGIQPGVQTGIQTHIQPKTLPAPPVFPVKGQMTNLVCPPHRLRSVLRAPGVYLIPRGDGRVTVGSTLEHAGFDPQPNTETCLRLTEAARNLIPEAQPHNPPQIWAGLRPGTPDGLPILGPSPHSHCWHATGHYRDGILLAPATAHLMAQSILTEPTDVSLAPFSLARF